MTTALQNSQRLMATKIDLLQAHTPEVPIPALSLHFKKDSTSLLNNIKSGTSLKVESCHLFLSKVPSI